jgi:hypothetical protein
MRPIMIVIDMYIYFIFHYEFMDGLRHKTLMMNIAHRPISPLLLVIKLFPLNLGLFAYMNTNT